MPSNESSKRSTTSRRSFLAATGVATATAMTGCTGLLDFVGNQVLGHVNVFNGIDQRVSGSITVSGPDGETLLDETFELVSSNTESSDGQSSAVFDDVWSGAGSYEASVELDDATIDGESQATGTVEITDTDEQMLAVVLGVPDTEEPIAFRVGTSFSEFVSTATQDTTS